MIFKKSNITNNRDVNLKKKKKKIYREKNNDFK